MCTRHSEKTHHSPLAVVCGLSQGLTRLGKPLPLISKTVRRKPAILLDTGRVQDAVMESLNECPTRR
jgi:hypothetical protein